MTTEFITIWASAGILVGLALAFGVRCLLTVAPPASHTTWLMAVPLTSLVFGGLAWRFGHQFDLLPYSVLAALGVALSAIDAIDRRLPSVLIYSGVAVVGVLLASSAIMHSRGPDFVRALAGMAVVAVFYLVLALVSGGGLGAGDVKLGGLLGLALGWLSWSALVTATAIGWFAAALIWLVLRMFRRRPEGSLLPMGPFLLFGALVTITLVPT
ncbi:prepilin peptidase [Amycolatopsis balhimycina DSM 5908]|uniref:Prepilin peptidase n=1 Tax=Amycolatopsis balhimycina DSM 5908 TaxID=1081091 RepID=A0A428VYI8_AMYBA|nr:A24 family peptidase [Amycolatopsis balhimycina]RSM35880.1 prepilin peptidase [Amycolatopsis balhimycina DSM 5908]